MKRAFFLGCVLSAGIAVLEPVILMRIQAGGLASDFMSAGALAGLLLVILLSGLLSFIHRRFILNPPELILIFIMVSVASVVPSWGLMGNLFPVVAGMPYFANPQNNWAGIFLGRLKPYLINQDLQAVTYFYEGAPAGTPIAYLVWLKPLAFWFAPVFLFYFLSVCLAVVFRREWVENERLTFPLAIVPLEMTRKKDLSERLPSLFKNKLMWLGFALSSIVISLNALPFIDLRLSTAIPIFRGTASLVFFLSFPIIGFAYLLNLNIAFSLWLFHLLARLQTGWFNITGYSLTGTNEVFGGSSAATSFQGGGAMLVLFLFIAWTARRHLSAVFRKAWRPNENIDDSQEILPYRTAVLGIIVSLVLLAAFLRFIGMPLPVVILFLFLVLAVFVGLTRIIAQAGIGFARSQCIPPDFTAYALPPTLVTDSGYTALGLQYAWAADIRTTVLASTMNGLKMQAEARIKPSLLFWAIIVSLVLAYIFSAATILQLGYRHGALNAPNSHFFGAGMPSAIASFIANKITHPLTPAIILPRLFFAGLGALIMGFLTFMSQRFLWWPLHYIGFPIADTYVMQYAWFSIFIAWFIKSLILRYGGPLAYRRSIPFFIGLILGVMGATIIWTTVNILAGYPVHNFLIGVS